VTTLAKRLQQHAGLQELHPFFWLSVEAFPCKWNFYGLSSFKHNCNCLILIIIFQLQLNWRIWKVLLVQSQR